MKTFREHIQYRQSLQENLIQMVFIMENYEDLMTVDGYLDESKADDLAGKAGLTIHKSKGLIQYLNLAASGVRKMFMAGIKGDKEGVKAVMNSVDREDILDFLYKLDLASLHIVTAPLHFIDAVTGYELGVKHVIKDIEAVRKEIKTSVINLKQLVKKSYEPPIEKKIVSHLSAIEKKL